MARPARTGLRLWDRLVLLVAWAVTCGVVYALGFYTGRGSQERQLGREERVVRLPVTSKPPAEGQRPKEPSDLTFYEKLLSGSGDGAPAPKPPAAAALPGPPAKSATVIAAPPPALPTVPPPPSASVGPAAPAKSAPAAPSAPPKPASAPVATATPRTPPPPAPPPPVSAHSASGGWTVEANPTQDRVAAEAVLGRLRSRGYDVTLERVLREGGTWYRLRVGRYASAGEANDAMRRLRDQEGVPHAFVAAE